MQVFIGCIGIVVLLLMAVLFSNNIRAIKLSIVLKALLVQTSIGAVALYIPIGRKILLLMSNSVNHLIEYGNEGIDFLFGGLVSKKMSTLLGHHSFIFALRVLPIIIFFSAFISVLYYLKIMQFLINTLGNILHKFLNISRVESLSITANIFLGQTEAPMIIRPYISNITNSELFTVMCGGLASVAGSALAGYAQIGVPTDYLIAASFMAAPGSLLFSKIIFPETSSKRYELKTEVIEKEKLPCNILDAAASGAASGLNLALNVGAMLLAFVALIALINGILSGIGAIFSYPQLSLSLLLGWVFSPIAWIIGIPWNESGIAGSFIGQKLVINEFVAYTNFSSYLRSDAEVTRSGLQVISNHTKAIISFALCGFANLSSIGVLIGGLGTMIPNRRQDIAKLGLKAVIAGTFSNLMSAAIAGIFTSLRF